MRIPNFNSLSILRLNNSERQKYWYIYSSYSFKQPPTKRKLFFRLKEEQKMHIYPHFHFSISVIWYTFLPYKTTEDNYGQANSDNFLRKHINSVFSTVSLEVIDNWYLTTWKHFLIWSRCGFQQACSTDETTKPSLMWLCFLFCDCYFLIRDTFSHKKKVQ